MLAVFQARRVTCKSSDDESSSGGTASAGKRAQWSVRGRPTGRQGRAAAQPNNSDLYKG